jgi:hypothetical protein
MVLEEIVKELEEVNNELKFVDSKYYNKNEKEAVVQTLISKVGTLIDNINLEIWKNNLK